MESSDFAKFVDAVNASLDDLEPVLEPITAKSLDDILAPFGSSKEDTLEKIKVINNYTYTLISLLFSQLKSKGVDTNNHPIKFELERIQSYMKRAKAIETGQSTEEEKKKEQQKKSAELIQQVLGTKSTPGGAAGEEMAKPAILEDTPKAQTSKFKHASKRNKPTKNRVDKPRHSKKK